MTGFETNISVRPGAQLSTVLTATTVFARSAIETSAFEREGEHGDERACAEAVADCAEAIRGDYEDAIESDY